MATYSLRIERREPNPDYVPFTFELNGYHREDRRLDTQREQFIGVRVCEVELTPVEYDKVRRAVIDGWTFVPATEVK